MLQRSTAMTTRSHAGNRGTRDVCSEGDAASADLVSADIIGIFDAIDLPIIVVGRDCTVARFNEAATALLRLTPSDLGRSPRDLRVLTAVKDIEKLCMHVVGGGAPC